MLRQVHESTNWEDNMNDQTPMTPKEFGAWVADYEKRTFDTVSFREFTPEYLEIEEAHAPHGGNDE